MSHLFASDGKSIGASVSILPMNIQGWFHLGLSGLISLQSKDSQESSNHNSKAAVLQHSGFFMVKVSHADMTTRKIIALTIWTLPYWLSAKEFAYNARDMGSIPG